jgi:hypothetical protein
LGTGGRKDRLQHEPFDVLAFMKYHIQYVVSRVVGPKHEFDDFEQMAGYFWRAIFENDPYKVWRRTDSPVWTFA